MVVDSCVHEQFISSAVVPGFEFFDRRRDDPLQSLVFLTQDFDGICRVTVLCLRNGRTSKMRFGRAHEPMMVRYRYRESMFLHCAVHIDSTAASRCLLLVNWSSRSAISACSLSASCCLSYCLSVSHAQIKQHGVPQSATPSIGLRFMVQTSSCAWHEEQKPNSTPVGSGSAKFEHVNPLHGMRSGRT